jgi:decaprenyl-phosphate phosphoribosyltransferase
MSNLKAYVAIARPDHWIKNLFALPGVLFALLLAPLFAPARSLTGIVLTLVALVVASSANYTLNEWLDRDFDRHHPSKQSRPAVSGRVASPWVWLQYAGLAVVSLAVVIPLGTASFLLLLFFLIMGVVYNVPPIRTKERAYIDVLSEAINNPVRFTLGWLAVTTVWPPTSVLIAYWFAGAFLMAMKRYAELRSLLQAGANAANYRRSFAHYTPSSLLQFSVACALAAAMGLAIFLDNSGGDLYWLGLPGVVALFSLYIALSMRADSPAQRPEALWREGSLLGLAALAVLLMVLGILL